LLSIPCPCHSAHNIIDIRSLVDFKTIFTKNLHAASMERNNTAPMWPARHLRKEGCHACAKPSGQAHLDFHNQIAYNKSNATCEH